MAPSAQLLGDVPLKTLLRENPGHGLQEWVIESYLLGETLRTKRNAADAVRFIDCGIRHAFHPDGVQSEQHCPHRTTSAVCFHGEQWDSGLGIIRQFVQSSAAVRLATSEEIAVITTGQDAFGVADMIAHRDAPGMREGRYALSVLQQTARQCQQAYGPRILAVRDVVSSRALAILDLPYEEWKANRV